MFLKMQMYTFLLLMSPISIDTLPFPIDFFYSTFLPCSSFVGVTSLNLSTRIYEVP